MDAAAIALTLLLVVAGTPARPRVDTAPAALPNDNRTPAGRRVGDTLALRLTVRRVAWYIHTEREPALDAIAFAEEERAATIPGPLVRAREGTPVRVGVRNPLADTLFVHGLGTRGDGAPDSLVVPPGATAEARFTAGRAGAYVYWATTSATPPATRTILGRRGPASQLSGAFVVDPPNGVPVPPDRVLVITAASDTFRADGLQFRDRHGVPAREFVAVNGKSWPHTERLTYALGDSIRWRVVNASMTPHPLHLHGFYFRVDAHGDDGADVDTLYAPNDRRMAVTEVLTQGQTMSVVWSPDRPGGWIFHCHLTIHAVLEAPLGRRGVLDQPEGHEHGDPDRHAFTGMNGIVVATTVVGRPNAPNATPAAWRPARSLRLYVQSDSQPGDTARRFGYVLDRGAEPRRDSVEYPGPLLVLTRGEPTTIEVVNRAPEPTAVHWHGVEIDNYFDGVIGLGVDDTRRTTPAIRPGGTFAVHVTPRRAGTFMYHTHFDELRQQYGGLVGAVVVLEPGERWDPERDRAFVVTDPSSTQPRRLYVNGSLAPPPVTLRVGATYRFRIANITADAPSMRVRLTHDSTPVGQFAPIAGDYVTWRPVAKDGWTLPAGQAAPRPSGQRVASGETADFAFTPDRPGDLALEVYFVDPARGRMVVAGVVRLRVTA
jgi:FtsP/CotA-like multicopper oxidase with cupredoxin domain